MISNSLIQYFKVRVILTSAMLASTTAGVSAAVPSHVATRAPAANLSVQLASVQPNSVQLAQSAAVVYPTLQTGSTGETVSRLQATLKLLGFYQGDVDGTYGQSTQQAVVAFQSATSLATDGIAGPATWRKLLPTPDDTEVADSTSNEDTANEDTASAEAPTEPAAVETDSEPATSNPPILRPSAEGPAVSQLQTELQTLGYYSGAIDGSYGELTEAAVRKFQADRQLLVDAVVGPSTWDALSRALEE